MAVPACSTLIKTIVFPMICLAALVAGSSIRLYAGGPSGKEGVVQVYVEGEWKTICSNEWDALDALVTCRELGFTDGYAMVRNEVRRISYNYDRNESIPTTESPRSFPVEGNRFACNGTEQSLLSCRYNKHQTYCSSFASVACGITPAEYQILVDDLDSNYYHNDLSFSAAITPGSARGRVLSKEGNDYYRDYSNDQAWLEGGICDMDYTAAMLICDEQGYKNGGKPILVPEISNLPMLISEISCDGEWSLNYCNVLYTSGGMCPNDVMSNGVQCYTKVRPSVIGALAFAAVACIFILIAGAFGIHWIRRNAKIPTSASMNLTVGEHDDATPS